MMAQIKTMWAERLPRERQLLAVMFALFAIVILIFGIIRPLANATSAARDRLDRVTIASGQIAAAADTLREAKKNAPPPLTGTMLVAVTQSAQEAGFNLSTLDSQGEDRVGIAMPAVKSAALFGWLRKLAPQGIFVERMTMRANADATLSIEGTLRLRKP
jgi:general secretion pathway protein M